MLSIGLTVSLQHRSFPTAGWLSSNAIPRVGVFDSDSIGTISALNRHITVSM